MFSNISWWIVPYQHIWLISWHLFVCCLIPRFPQTESWIHWNGELYSIHGSMVPRFIDGFITCMFLPPIMVHNLSFQQHPHALTIPRARQTCMRTLTVFCNKIDRVFSMVWDNPSTWEWLHFCVLLPLVSFKSFMLQQKNSIHFIIQDQPPLTLTRHPKLVYLSRRQKNVSLIKLRTSSDTARKQCLSLLLWTNCPHHPKQSLSWARLFCWLAHPVYKVSELVIHCTRSSQLHSSLDSSSRRSATSTFISDVHWCLWGLWSRCGTQKTLPSYTWRCELHCLVRNGITKLTHLRLDAGRQVSNVSSIRLRTFSADIYLREIISRIPQ